MTTVIGAITHSGKAFPQAAVDIALAHARKEGWGADSFSLGEEKHESHQKAPRRWLTISDQTDDCAPADYIIERWKIHNQ